MISQAINALGWSRLREMSDAEAIETLNLLISGTVEAAIVRERVAIIELAKRWAVALTPETIGQAIAVRQIIEAIGARGLT